VGQVSTEASEAVAKGLVIRSSPAAGTLVDPNSAVGLVVSNGPSQVTVPDVVGKTEAGARQAIGEVKLTFESTNEVSQKVPGTVLRSTPAAGTKVDPGSTVTVVLAIAAVIN
jgi:serine/threonine-protein kinase